jgi:hypothetical protein
MFGRTFALSGKNLDMTKPTEIVRAIEDKLSEDLVGFPATPFLFFVDANKELQKLVFYDMCSLETTMEFSSIFGRFPEYSVSFDGEKSVKIHYFHEDQAIARIRTVSVGEKDGRKVVLSTAADDAGSDAETVAVRQVTSVVTGLLDAAQCLDGKVTCSVVENEHTKEKLPFFTLRIDDRSEKNRAVIRSCERMYFAWSEDGSSMILICRFKMMPPFAMSFPIMGRSAVEAMSLFIQAKKGVGMVMFSDDVNDAFTINDCKPTFE